MFEEVFEQLPGLLQEELIRNGLGKDRPELIAALICEDTFDIEDQLEEWAGQMTARNAPNTEKTERYLQLTALWQAARDCSDMSLRVRSAERQPGVATSHRMAEAAAERRVRVIRID